MGKQSKLYIYIYICYYVKKVLNSDDQQFYQYQQDIQSPVI
jgi:hypothetical protein